MFPKEAMESFRGLMHVFHYTSLTCIHEVKG